MSKVAIVTGAALGMDLGWTARQRPLTFAGNTGAVAWSAAKAPRLRGAPRRGT